MNAVSSFVIALGLSVIASATQAGERPVGSRDRHQEIAQIERQRVASLVSGDIKTASRLHAPDFQLINPLGGALTKEEYLGGLESGFLDYLIWQPGEISVRRHGKTAVLRYQSQLQIVIGGDTAARALLAHRLL